MAREKKKSGGPKAMWLVTFSDLMTLLLTFFVLLLSMSSMDQSFLTRVTVATQDIGLLSYKGAGRVTAYVREIAKILDRPWEVLEKQNRIKDLLFPDQEIPPEIDRQDLMENLEILQRPEGVALVLSDDLLFGPARYVLSEEAKFVLGRLEPILTYVSAPINIAGFTDDLAGRTMDNLELSGMRALSVLEHLVYLGMHDRRFSISAYGPNFPVAPNDDAAGRAKNRRVEILVKTTAPIGGYM